MPRPTSASGVGDMNPAEFARICTAPKTPEEMVIAFAYPHSPLKKALASFLEEEAALRFEIVHFIQRLILMDMIREKAIMKAQLEYDNSVDAYMDMKRQEEAGRPLELKPEKVYDLDVRLADVDKKVSGLEQQREQLVQELQTVDKQLQDVNEKWETKQQQVAKEFVNELIKQMPDIQQDKVKQQGIEDVLKLSSPVRLLNINPALADMHLVMKEKDGNAENAVVKQGAAMQKHAGLMRELMVNVVLAKDTPDEELTPAKILANIKKNKLKFKMPRQSPEEATLICDAITGVCRKKKVEADIELVAKGLETAIKERKIIQKDSKELPAANSPDGA